MRGKIKQDSTTLTTRHPFKPNLTWSITDNWLRRKDVESTYVQSMRSLLKNTKRRFMEIIGQLEYIFSSKSLKLSYSQYIHFAYGDSYCDPPSQNVNCPYPRKGCSACEFNVESAPYKPTKLGFLLVEVVANYQMLLKVIGCFIHGHDLCGCGHAGPDSGSMDYECQRCCEYWSVPLY